VAGSHIGGWELVTLDAPSRIDGEDAYRRALPGRHADVVRCLLATHDPSQVYDLRIVSVPRPPAPNDIRVGVLVRSESPGAVDGLGALLTSSFPEATFRPLDPPDPLLRPFRPRHRVRIVRRHGMETLGTLRRTSRAIGFNPGKRTAAEDEAEIFHVFPFSAGGTDHGRLLRSLLLHEHPVLLSIRLRPAMLTEAEEGLLEEAIEICDDYARALRVGSAGTKVALEEQTIGLQRLQTRRLEALSDECCELSIELSSSEPVPHILVDAVGAIVTGPPGGADRRPSDLVDAYLMGGYDTVEVKAAALDRLDMPAVDGEAPEVRLVRLFDAVEAARAFRLPEATLPEPTGISRRSWAMPLPPADLPHEGTLVGEVQGREWRIAEQDLLRHVYVVGQTGTGKTTLLQTMILDDVNRGEGVCVIDPHGDLHRWILARIPERRWDDVVVVDPLDVRHPVGFNPLECAGDQQRHRIVQEVTGIIHRMVRETFAVDVAGPVFFQHVRMNLLLVMSDPDRPGTLLDFYNVFQDSAPERRWKPPTDADPLLRDWVTRVLPRTDYTAVDSSGVSMGGYVSSKFQPFVFDPLLRNILGQRRSTFDLRTCMDERKIVLVNLAKGALTEDNAYWLGRLFLSRLLVEAMGRIDVPPDRRPPFHLYVDEFQSMASESFVSMLSEGRKFGLAVVMANQFVAQIDNPRIPAAIFGNVGTVIGFRTGLGDAELLGPQFAPEVVPDDFLALPNWHAYASGLVAGAKLDPMLIRTIPPTTKPVPNAVRMVTARSRRQYTLVLERAEADVASAMIPESGS